MRLSNKIKSCTVLTLHRRSHGATPLTPSSKAQGPPEWTPNSDRTGGPERWGHTNKLKSCTAHALHRRTHGVTPSPPSSTAESLPERTFHSDRTGGLRGFDHPLKVLLALPSLAMSLIPGSGTFNSRCLIMKCTKLILTAILLGRANGAVEEIDLKCLALSKNSLEQTTYIDTLVSEADIRNYARQASPRNSLHKYRKDKDTNRNELISRLTHEYNADEYYQQLLARFVPSQDDEKSDSKCNTIAFVDADGSGFWNSYFLAKDGKGLRDLVEHENLKHVYWVILMGANNFDYMMRTEGSPQDEVEDMIEFLKNHDNVWFDCQVTASHDFFLLEDMIGENKNERLREVQRKDLEVVDNWIRFLSIWMSEQQDLKKCVDRWIILSNDESLSCGRTDLPGKNKEWGHNLCQCLRYPNTFKKGERPTKISGALKKRLARYERNEKGRLRKPLSPEELQELINEINKMSVKEEEQFRKKESRNRDSKMKVIGLSFNEFGGVGHDKQTTTDYFSRSKPDYAFHCTLRSGVSCQCGWTPDLPVSDPRYVGVEDCKNFSQLVTALRTRTEERCLELWSAHLVMGVYKRNIHALPDILKEALGDTVLSNVESMADVARKIASSRAEAFPWLKLSVDVPTCTPEAQDQIVTSPEFRDVLARKLGGFRSPVKSPPADKSANPVDELVKNIKQSQTVTGQASSDSAAGATSYSVGGRASNSKEPPCR